MVRKYFIAYLLLFICGFGYLANHSIINLDEVMLLDPCINFLKGNYASKIWYAAGTEDHFMAYLPATSALRLLFLKILPNSLFFHRLPFIVIFFLCAILIYKISNSRLQNKLLTILTVVLFINDKGIWDATISGRSEILQVFFILIFFYLELKTNTYWLGTIKGVVVGCLFLTHPPAWSIALLLMIFLFKKKRPIDSLLTILAALLPVLFFLISINFNVTQLIEQLFMNGSKADLQEGFFYRITHFYLRFIPYPYLYQPWVIILLFASIIYSFNLRIFKDQYVRKICIVFIGYLFFLILFSENYYRYNPPLLVGMYLLLPALFQYAEIKYNLLINSKQVFFLILLISIPFGVRTFNSFKNRDFNNTTQLISQFEDSALKYAKYPVLLIGEPVGYYFSLKHSNIDYSTFYTSQKFNFHNYHRIQYLTYEYLPEETYVLLHEFEPNTRADGTYKGLKLYELINSEFFLAQDKEKHLKL